MRINGIKKEFYNNLSKSEKTLVKLYIALTLFILANLIRFAIMIGLI